MLGHEHKRLFLVPGLLQPLKGKIHDDIGGIAGMLPTRRRTVFLPVFHGRVIIGTLPDQDFIVIKPGRRRLQMPLSKHRGRVSLLTEELGKGLLRSIKGIPITNESIEMAIFARKYHRTARPTDGVGNVAAVKPHPLLCNCLLYTSDAADE